MTADQAVIPPSSLGPSQLTKARVELQSRADRTISATELDRARRRQCPQALVSQVQGQQKTWSAGQLGHFLRMAGQTSFSLQGQDSLLYTHTDLEFSRTHQASSLGGFG